VGVSFGDSEVEPASTEIDAESTGVVSVIIDADWLADDLIGMLTALGETYRVFLALDLDRRVGGGSLGSIAPDIDALLPESRLAIPAMRFASKGIFSFEGLGEVVREVRLFLLNLETIGQRRKANRLELEKKELELHDLRSRLAGNRDLDEAERRQRLQQHQFELMQLRQEVTSADLEIGRDHLEMTVEQFRAIYGPDWREQDGAKQQFERLLGSGGRLLTEFGEGRVELPPASERRSPTGDGGF
jgi:hypothetical protein